MPLDHRRFNRFEGTAPVLIQLKDGVDDSMFVRSGTHHPIGRWAVAVVDPNEILYDDG